MAITTQRLIILVILVNLAVGIAASIYDDPTVFTLSEVNHNLQTLEDQEHKFYQDDTLWGGIRDQEQRSEVTIGNTKKMGVLLVKTFFYGLTPLVIHPNLYETNFEQLVAFLLDLARAIIGGIMLFEFYLVIKNKKNT